MKLWTQLKLKGKVGFRGAVKRGKFHIHGLATKTGRKSELKKFQPKERIVEITSEVCGPHKSRKKLSVKNFQGKGSDENN